MERIPAYDSSTQVDAINEGYAALREGTYEICKGFSNPLYRKNGSGLIGSPTVAAGFLFRVSRRTFRSDAVHWNQVSLAGVTEPFYHAGSSYGDDPFDLTYGEVGHLDLRERKILRFVELFLQNSVMREQTFGDRINKLDPFDATDVLAYLVEREALTVEQIVSAYQQLQGMDLGAFRHLHGIG